MTRIMVAGIGSPHGRDIAGWLVIDSLEEDLPEYPSSMVLRVKLRTPMDLLDRAPLGSDIGCDGEQIWILIDACVGIDPGTVHRWTWPEIPNELATRSSTHALGLIETIRVAESLGILAKQVRIYGVSTEDLQASVDRCAELIRSDLSELLA
ncbi:MAG: hydrogenase maturation protease [Pirellula sp.]